jgi:hypothetical protein
LKSQAGGRGLIYALVDAFCVVRTKPKPKLDFLANVIFNVTQHVEGRRLLMLHAGEGCVLQRLVPFMSHASDIRRGGIVGAVRNCCFEAKEHQWLLGPEVNLATHLLLPLAGPEELDEDDMDGMPDDLQVAGQQGGTLGSFKLIISLSFRSISRLRKCARQTQISVKCLWRP